MRFLSQVLLLAIVTLSGDLLVAQEFPQVTPVPQSFFIPEQAASSTAWTFDQVISQVLTSDPKLRIGNEEIRQARAEYWTSSLPPNPIFTAEGGVLPFNRNRITPDRPGGPPELNLQVEFPIDWFLFAKRKAAMNSAAWDVRQSQAAYADLIRERITETATLFYDVLEAKALLAAVYQDVEILIHLEKIAKQGVEAGGLPVVEWKQIRLDLLQSRLELLEAEKTLEILKAQLRVQFGSVDYDPAFDITGDLDAPTDMAPMPLETAFAMARQNRPDIRAFRMQMARSQADVRLEKRNAYPEVTPQFGYTRQYQKSQGEDDYSGWGVGVSVTVPLFNRNQGNRARARSALAQSTHQYQAGIVDLRAEIIEADRNLRTAHQQAHTFADEEVRLAREVRDTMIESFKAGGRPLIDVLDAERRYRETIRLFITCRADYWRALYIYKSVVGVDTSDGLLSPVR
ncbi:MAG: TolC family protein [Planctomycetaceae bacterium]|nr:TolC family protein [Planctomycetaceae bacterium]